MGLVRTFIIVGTLTTATASVTLAQQSDRPPGAAAEIRTSGVASITVPPDLATIGIEFTAKGKSPREAGRSAAERANAIRQALITVGIPRDSMPTVGRWGWWGARSQMNVSYDRRDTSYVTSDVFTVRIRNLKLIGAVIDTALGEGAQTISNIQFTATDTRRANLQALKQATQLARENAEAIAAAGGGRLGRTIEMATEPQRYSEESPFRLSEVTAMAGGGGETTVVAPQLKVTVTVYGRWEYR